MKFQMAQNSLFAVLLRSPWWVSGAIGLVLGVAGLAVLPAEYRAVGAVSGLPFLVICAIAAKRQWRLPSAARVAQTHEAVAALAWPAFATLLTEAFARDGYTVSAGQGDAVDLELAKGGRRTLVSARRWKSARPGLESLRALQAARQAQDASEALCIVLAPLSDAAVPYATANRITVWHAAELAQLLRGTTLPTPAPGRR